MSEIVADMGLTWGTLVVSGLAIGVEAAAMAVFIPFGPMLRRVLVGPNQRSEDDDYGTLRRDARRHAAHANETVADAVNSEPVPDDDE